MANPEGSETRKSDKSGMKTLWGWLGLVGVVAIVVALTFVYSAKETGTNGVAEKSTATGGAVAR